MAKKEGNSIVKGTLVLIAGNLIVKIIGALFKLPLANIIGADGMGLYNASFIVYDIFLVLATAGFPLAVSKMVSASCAHGNHEEAIKIFKVSRNCFLVIGLIFTALMFSGAVLYAQWIGNSRAYLAILTLSPAILFVALMSAYRGYYQGINDMIPTTISQITEAICRLVVGLSLSWYLNRAGYEPQIVAAGAILGITAGEFVSTFSLALIHRHKMRTRTLRPKRKTQPVMSAGKIISTMFATSVPIGIGTIVISAINAMDNVVVMRRLESIGYNEQQANMLYGTYNMAFTVFSLPITIVSALIVSVFPVLSYAYACKNIARVNRTACASLRITVIVGMASAALFLSLSYPIVMLLFFRQPQAARVAAMILTVLAPTAVPITIFMLTSAILQAVDQLFAPTCSSIIGGIACLLCNWVLIGQKSIGIFGAPVGLFVCYTLASVLNMMAIGKCKDIRLSVRHLFDKALIPSAVMGVTGFVAFRLTLSSLGLLKAAFFSILVALVNYMLVLFLNHTLERDDILLLPKGHAIVHLLEKLHLMNCKLV
ncbi:MAG: polysaccharide biosynthesis protein [Ethanoligenens sp.]